jgi:hypothetical protein
MAPLDALGRMDITINLFEILRETLSSKLPRVHPPGAASTAGYDLCPKESAH